MASLSHERSCDRPQLNLALAGDLGQEHLRYAAMQKKADAAKYAASREPHAGFTIDRYYRYWKVSDPVGELVCVTVYKRGAEEVVRRLADH
jgi:hypothetical protein